MLSRALPGRQWLWIQSARTLTGAAGRTCLQAYICALCCVLVVLYALVSRSCSVMQSLGATHYLLLPTLESLALCPADVSVWRCLVACLICLSTSAWQRVKLYWALCNRCCKQLILTRAVPRRRVSLAVFGHVLDLDLSFHLSRKTGEVTKVVDRGTAAIQNVLSTILFSIAPQVRTRVLMVTCI
jgi:hypothetical protein